MLFKIILGIHHARHNHSTISNPVQPECWELRTLRYYMNLFFKYLPNIGLCLCFGIMPTLFLIVGLFFQEIKLFQIPLFALMPIYFTYSTNFFTKVEGGVYRFLGTMYMMVMLVGIFLFIFFNTVMFFSNVFELGL